MELCHTATRTGRLSSFLRGEMAMSAGLVNRLKWSQRILVNGAPQHNDFLVSPGDVICALPVADKAQAQCAPRSARRKPAHLAQRLPGTASGELARQSRD